MRVAYSILSKVLNLCYGSQQRQANIKTSAVPQTLFAISTLELYYMPTVHTFNMKRIDSLIKESDKELQQYIEALKRASDGWERLAKDAVAKLRQQTTAAAQNLPLDCQGVPADSGRGKLSGVR